MILFNKLYYTRKVMHRAVIYLFITVTALYLFIGTGLHGDDYSVIAFQRDIWEGIVIPTGWMKLNIFAYDFFWWAYTFFGFEHQWVYDLVKAFAHASGLFFVYRFALDYLPRDRAILASVLFILYPLHDTTMYWYMTVPYVFFPAVIMLAHAMIRHDRFVLGVLLSGLGAFSGYFSPPYVFGLASIFLFEYKYKKAALFVLPGVLYVLYYFWVKFNSTGAEHRINSNLTIPDIFRQLLLQPLSFFDAAFGPSYWFKIYYAIGSLGFVSSLIAVSITGVLLFKAPLFSKRPDFPRSLLLGFVSVLLLSFGMFSLTGLYYHSPFNLGNRTTVYGSLLIAFLLVMLPINRKAIIFFAIVFIFPVFGLSDYWKSWNEHQKAVIENIHSNKELAKLEPESTLLVTGNLYSKLGPFSNIEFFSMYWVVTSIFHDWVKSNNVMALAPYIELDHGSLVDQKFGGRYPLERKIYVYNSEANTVSPIALASVPQLLADRPREIRHWVQLAKGTWIESSIVALSPRLSYLFL